MKTLQNLGKILLLMYLPCILYASPSLKLELSKTEVYVGESLKAKVTLQYSKEDKIINHDFEEFIADDFWIKELQSKIIRNGDTFTFLLYEFIITPQKSGKLTILEQKLRVAKREDKTNFTKWNDYFTNKKSINVLPLPKDTKIQGNFTIEVIDFKPEVKENKALNFKIKIKGYGNFEDIKSFDLKLKNQLVYKSELIQKVEYVDNKNQGELSQSFAILANNDYKIPAIEFKYFNRDEKKIKTLKTKEYKVKIIDKKTSITNKNYSLLNLFLFLFLGICLGIILTLVIYKITVYRKNIQKKKTLCIKVKNARTNKDLYKLLLPYSNKIELQNIIEDLEANIYKSENKKINKKEILAFLRLL